MCLKPLLGNLFVHDQFLSWLIFMKFGKQHSVSQLQISQNLFVYE